MTIPEMLGGLVATITAALGAYRAVSGKLEGMVGKAAPDDGGGSLRDVVMRIEGKLDAHRETTAEQFQGLGDRVGRLESRVFTPPGRRAFRSTPGDQ